MDAEEPSATATSSPPSATHARAAGTWVAGSVQEMVYAAERVICAAHAVDSPAVAEGLARAGHRAACVSDATRASDLPAFHADVPWVYHGPSGHPPTRASFVLCASSAQDAVDHCLAAHAIAERLQQPGCCLLDPRLAARLDSARLPVAF